MSTEQKKIDITSDEFRREWGEKLFQFRDYTPIPLILIALYLAQPTALSSTIGLISIFLGEAIRIYSVSFIGGVSRTRSDSLGASLVDEGPYGWVRNPLYVGNLFITMGIAIFSGHVAVIILAAVLFSLQYFLIVGYEEELLVQKFGQDYVDYKSRVPAWIPQQLPKLEEIPPGGSLSEALRHEKSTLTAIGAMVLILILIGGR